MIIPTKYLVTGALVAAVLVLELRRAHAAKLTCGPGSKLQRMSLDEARALWGSFQAWPEIEAQIKKYGGTCTKQGTVTDAGTRELDDVGADEPDSYLITQPSQVM